MNIKTSIITPENSKKISPLIIPCLLLFIWGGVLYSNTLNAPFYLDDFANVTDIKAIKVEGISIKSIQNVLNDSLLKTRPIANISFALNYLIGGEEVIGYHLVNIMIHIATSLLIFLIIHHILITKTPHITSSDKTVMAFLSALLWICHPLHTQSVTYIIQRMNSMSVMFILLSFYLYTIGRDNPGSNPKKYLYILSLAAWILAIGSKEIAVVLPALVLVYEWYFNNSAMSSRRSILRLYIPAFLLLLCIFSLLYFDGNPFPRILNSYNQRNFSLPERLLTETRVVIHYLSLFFYPDPSRLSLEYGFPISTSPINPPATMLSIILIGALISSAISNDRNKLFSFSIIWFFVGLVIESTILPLEIIFEHRTYLPTTFLFFPIVLLIFKCIKNKMVRYLIFISIILFMSGATFYRNNQWNEPIVFWEKALAIAPESSRAHNYYGMAIQKKGEVGKAIIHYRKAISLKPSNTNALNNLGMALYSQNLFSEAKSILLKVISHDPKNDKIYNNLGMISARERDFVNAIIYLKKSIDLTGGNANTYSNIGSAYAETGDYNKALHFLKKSIQLNKNNSAAHTNIGNVFVLLNRSREAIPYYNEALRINPNDTNARRNLNIALKNITSDKP